MHSLLSKLLARAWRECAVLTQPLEDGLQLLVYPDGDDALVGIGYGRTEAHRLTPEELLRRRSARIATLGAWLPACFIDGSAYLVRRIAGAQSDSWPGDAELAAVRELLA